MIGTLNIRCRIVVGIQNWDHHFDNHPYGGDGRVEGHDRAFATPTAPRAVAGSGPVGDRIRGTLGAIDPLKKVPVQESQKKVKKGSLSRVPLVLPRSQESHAL